MPVQSAWQQSVPLMVQAELGQPISAERWVRADEGLPPALFTNLASVFALRLGDGDLSRAAWLNLGLVLLKLGLALGLLRPWLRDLLPWVAAPLAALLLALPQDTALTALSGSPWQFASLFFVLALAGAWQGAADLVAVGPGRAGLPGSEPGSALWSGQLGGNQRGVMVARVPPAASVGGLVCDFGGLGGLAGGRRGGDAHPTI
ncbi:MAG: hypothetical protein HC915_06005 [Anaerolineae bacterium]|nr:hypothetical protein [Anaerolineae bacterium]